MGDGPTDEWLRRVHKGKTFESRYAGTYSSGGFMFPAGDNLLASVLIYSLNGMLCVLLLAYRRLIYGGELGGPPCVQRRDAAILTALWVVYIAGVGMVASANK